MNAQQLKNAILQEAIEGRLVPQDPNDEPASALLARIRKEKERLVKEGKLKKKDLEETPISEDEIPFEIPESWEWCRISNLFETSSGSTPQSKNPKYYSKGNINWVRTTDLNNGVLSSCEIQITKDAVADYHLSIIPRDSVCIAMYGGGGTIGKHSIIKFDTTINQSVCAIYPNGVCNMDYLHYFMQYQRPNWMDYAAGSRKDPNINQVIIKNCLFPLPPLAEQLRIVQKLNELLPKVEEYGKAQDALNKLNEELPERLKKSILQEAIEGRLVPQDPNDEPASVLLAKIRKEKEQLVKDGKLKKKDLIETPISEDEIPFEIPDSWEWRKLNDLCIFLSRGKSPSYSDVPTNYPVFAQKCNLKDGGISLEQARFLKPETVSKWQEEYHLRTDDVLVNSTGTGTVCRTRLFNENCLGNYPFTVPDSHVSVVRTSNNICSTYIFYLFNSKIYQDYWEDRLAGSTNQKELYIGVLQNTPIPLPPLAEQKRIVAKIEEVFKEIDTLKK